MEKFIQTNLPTETKIKILDLKKHLTFFRAKKNWQDSKDLKSNLSECRREAKHQSNSKPQFSWHVQECKTEESIESFSQARNRISHLFPNKAWTSKSYILNAGWKEHPGDF